MKIFLVWFDLTPFFVPLIMLVQLVGIVKAEKKVEMHQVPVNLLNRITNLEQSKDFRYRTNSPICKELGICMIILSERQQKNRGE